MAQLTRPPYCPVRGLGTVALCVARPLFEPSLCTACGGAAAAVLLLVSIAVRRPASSVGIFDLAAAEAGIAIGLWTSWITYPPCGPRQLCSGLLAQRFAVWQSALIGAAAMMVIVVVGAAVNTEFRRVNLGAARIAQRWLFKDLSRTSPIGGPDSDAG